MSKRESISRYSLIIKKLRKFASTFEEIENYLEIESEIQAANFNIKKRTFQRDLNDIRALYNIDIHYDKSLKAYRIFNDQQPEINERILEAFDTFNALNITDRLSAHIHFEKRKPQGTENLYGLLHAIKKEVQIKYTYEKYWGDEISQRTVEPYALKEFRNRWYLLAKDHKDEYVKSFSLDRLSNLEITKSPFIYPKDYDVNEHFTNCFGIISPTSDKPEEIILSFNAHQGKFIKSLPLHHTQEILKDNEEELLVKLTLFETHDLFMEILSFGANVKVIKPKSLIVGLKKALKEALELYD